MLIEHARHTAADLDHWRMLERMDAVNARRLGPRLDAMARDATAELLAFAQSGDGYLGVSWGKDSVVCAWLLHQIETAHNITFPAVYVVLSSGLTNPDSALVRDAFLARWPLREYHEIAVEDVGADAGHRSAPGFAAAAQRFGDRYASGVRADESVVRRMSMGHHGLTTASTCRPIGRWTTAEVYALAHREQLPLHPAYACTIGGLLDRRRIRVANIGGSHGTGFGRAEWERRYYPDARS